VGKWKNCRRFDPKKKLQDMKKQELPETLLEPEEVKRLAN
jgi:hypothetical protein